MLNSHEVSQQLKGKNGVNCGCTVDSWYKLKFEEAWPEDSGAKILAEREITDSIFKLEILCQFGDLEMWSP